MAQTIAWVATLAGWASAWTIGNQHHRTGWALAVATSAAWIAVNVAYGIWAGVISAAVAAGIAARNWRAASLDLHIPIAEQTETSKWQPSRPSRPAPQAPESPTSPHPEAATP